MLKWIGWILNYFSNHIISVTKYTKSIADCLRALILYPDDYILEIACSSYYNLFKHIINGDNNSVTITDIIFDNRKPILMEQYKATKEAEIKFFKEYIQKWQHKNSVVPIVIVAACREYFDSFIADNMNIYCYYDLTKIFMNLLKHRNSSIVLSTALRLLINVQFEHDHSSSFNSSSFLMF